MIEKVLVPIDFTEESDRVLVFVMGMKVFGVSEISLTHVMDVNSSTTWPVAPEIIETIEERLAKRQAKVEKAGFKVRTQILEGSPSAEVMRAAEDGGFSLIVVGSHGKTPIEEMFFGSVSEAVSRHSKVPVLLLRYEMLKEAAGAQSLLGYAAATFNKVLFPSDFSESSVGVIDKLEGLGRLGVGEVVTLHVVDTKRVETETEDMEQMDACYVDCGSVAEQLRQRKMNVSTMCRSGDPVDEILLAANDLEATVIVMGSHGKGMVKEWLDGSVSLSVLRRADRPIIIIHEAA